MSDIRPKKALGQHWLRDSASLKAIISSAHIGSTDTVLEIGPGQGSLTAHLVKRAHKVVAVELDAGLAKKLPRQVRAKNLEVINTDILKFDLTYLPPGYKVVANIPYYLTGKLLKIFTDTHNPPKQMALLLQKEVAERTAAKPGDMSILSVIVQLFYEPELGAVIPAELFYPKPKVDSQVLVLRRRDQPLFENMDTKKFFQVVKAGFSSPRKKLRSSLSAGLGISKKEAEQILEDAEVNKDLRPETLNLAQWHEIYVHALVKNDLRSLL